MIRPILKKSPAIISMLIFFLSTQCVNAQSKQLTIGQIVPDIKIDKILDEPEATMHSFKGKITIIDFWATWCGPCIAAMPHLAELQKKYPDKLNIISVSDEPEATVRKFLKKNPLSFKTALDTSKTLEQYFPRLSIPHTILMDESMKVLAITYPQMVTTKVIDEVLNGGFVSLQEKKYEIWDQDKNYLYADSTTLSKFELRNAISSLPTRLQTWQNDSSLNQRRLTFINFFFEDILMKSYNLDLKISQFDTGMDYAIFEKYYCVDVVIEEKNRLKLNTVLRDQLHRQFNINSRIDSIEQPVYALRALDKQKQTKSQKTEKVYPTSMLDSITRFKADNLTVGDFLSQVVEPLMQFPVLDQTGLKGRYDFDIRFVKGNFLNSMDNPKFHAALKKRGLEMVETKAKAPALFVYKQP